MATELTQDQIDAEQEKVYEEEYNKAFFGEEGEPSPEPVEEAKEDEQALSEVEKEEDSDVEEEGDDPEAEAETEESEEGEADSEDDADSGDPDNQSMDGDAADDGESDDLISIKWKGQDVKVTQEELVSLAQKGFDYTSKTQVLSDYKKQIQALEDAGISKEDIEIFARAKKGDKEALAHIVQSNGVDAVDLLDIEPNIDLHNAEPEVLISEQVAPLIAQVESNPEELASMHDAISKLPKAVTDVMQQDPEWFSTVHAEVTSGNFNEVIPQVNIRLAQMNDVQRTFVTTNPQAYANLYAEVLNGSQPQAVETPKIVTTPVKKEKPNMAEVGVKRNGGNDRRAEVKRDAFTDDKAYEATLARMKRTIG